MRKSSYFAVNSSGKISYISEAVLKYIDLGHRPVLGYPEGVLKKDDLVIYVKLNPLKREFIECEKKALNEIGIACTGLETSIFAVGLYKNKEIQTILKTKDVNLDTIFQGNDILIHFDYEKDELRVNINKQEIVCNPSQTEYEQLIVKNEEGLCYFRSNEKESQKQTCFSILNGERFRGYFYGDRVNGAFPTEVFSPNLAENMKRLREKTEETCEIFRHKNEILSMEFIPLDREGSSCGIYYLEQKMDVLAYMKEEEKRYWALENKEHEAGEKEIVPTTFRLWGEDPYINEVKHLLQKACDKNVTILLSGESGTGKTFLAKGIHKNSKRSYENFVQVNCAAIPYNLIESELFGYEEGAFTGARKGGKKGYFEQANHGTIFLDEITELPLSLQGKLLEVIQERKFYRVGGVEKVAIDVRLIAATNRDLRSLVEEGLFREDLYYRINVFPVCLPPLRQRKEALHAIIADVLPDICAKIDMEPILISPEALNKVKYYDWPGNIRELENVLEKAAILSDGHLIQPEDLILSEQEKEKVERNGSLREVRETCEYEAILRTLERFHGDRGKTAAFLEIGRTSLFEKMKKYNIQFEE